MKYKVTYLAHLMATAFVRVANDSILYANENEDCVRITLQASAWQRAKDSSSSSFFPS